MDPFVIVSPHLDDAVLSCGQFMAGRPDTTVVTVFAGWPDENVELTDFDQRSGFDDATAAVRCRRAEDVNATRLLHSDSVHLQFIDDQYRIDEPDVDEIAEQIVRTLESIGAHELLAPIGLRHPDHLATAAAALQLVGLYDVWLYEELPGRVLWPQLVCERHAEITSGEHGGLFDLSLEFIGEGALQLKARAVNSYNSQLWALDRHCLFVPERFHRVRVTSR